MKLRTFFAIALSCAILPLGSVAEVPQLLHYQGTVLDDQGEPASGTVDVEIGIWDAATGGVLLYAESHTAVVLSGGVFSLPLGEGEAPTGELDAELFSSPSRWLELTLDDEVLAPRQRIGSVGYALVAEEAERAQVAETLSELPPDSEVVSTAGGTFTGPVSLAGPSGMTNVTLGSVSGQPEHGLIAVNDADGGQSARLSVVAGGRGEVRVNDADGDSMVEVGSSDRGVGGYEQEDGTSSGFVGGYSGEVVTRGPKGLANVRLSSLGSRRDHGAVSVHDRDGVMRGALLVDLSGQGSLLLVDAAGKLRTLASGNGELFVAGPSGIPAVGLGTDPEHPDHGFVFVASPGGQGGGSLYVGPDGTGRLDLVDSALQARVQASADGSVGTYGPSGIRRTVIGAPRADLDPNDAVVAVANQAGDLRATMDVTIEGEAGQITTRGESGKVKVRIGDDPGVVQVIEEDRIRISLGVLENATAGDPAVFLMTDSSGNLRVGISDAEGGGLVLYGPNGNENAELSFVEGLPEHGKLEVHDADGEPRATLYVDTQGQGAVQVADAQGKVRAGMGVDNGAGLVETSGANGNANVRLSHLESQPDQGYLSVHNSEGRGVANLFADERGTGVVQMADADGGLAVAAGVATSGQGLLIVGSPNGSQNVRLSAPMGAPDNGSISVLDESSRVRALMEVQPTAGSGLFATLGPNGQDNVVMTSVVGYENHGLVSVHDSAGVAKAMMVVDPNGHGRIIADFKNFVVDHPTKPGQKIVYTSLEGPEAAMYYRGVVELVDGTGRIDLPEHFAVLAAPGTITAQLTPRSFESFGVAVDEIGEDHIEIAELFEGTGSYEVHFLVHAVRRGFEDYQPVMDNAEVQTMTAGISPSPPNATDEGNLAGMMSGT